MLVNFQIPSLLQGVSQLAPSVRSPAHADASDNTWPTFAEALQKRPPSQHVAQIVSGDVGDILLHGIDRDVSERYVLTLWTGPNPGDASALAFATDGTSHPIFADVLGNPPDFTYMLSATPARQALRMLTVQDYTFCVNRTVAVFPDSPLSPSETFGRAFVFIKQGEYQSNYTLNFKLSNSATIQRFQVRTWIGVVGTPPVAPELVDPNVAGRGTIKTDDIAYAFKVAIDLAAIAGISAVNTGAGALARESSVIEIVCTAGVTIDFIRLQTSVGDTLGIAFNRQIDNFDDLPLICRDAYVVKVRGDAASNEDDYHVRFAADNVAAAPFGKGRWIETIAPGVRTQLFADSMPHAFVQRTDPDGSITGTTGKVYFTFEEIPWVARVVGDDTSNPFPTFATDLVTNWPNLPVAHYIDSIYFYRNRLGFTSADHTILSESGRYFNFFRTSVTQVVDTDPIDQSAAEARVTNLFAGVPFDRSLITFSKSAQFALDGDPILTPKTASIAPIMSFEALDTCQPIAAKRGLFFAHRRGGFSALQQMSPVDAGRAAYDALDLSLHTPRYVPGDATSIIASADEGTIIMLPEDTSGMVGFGTALEGETPLYIYVYKQHIEGTERLQSAWFRWNFGVGSQVWGGHFFDSDLYLAVKRVAGTFLEKVQLSPGAADTGYSRWTYLDRRVNQTQCTLSYDATLDVTTITLPYDVESDNPSAVSAAGYWYTTLASIANVFAVRGQVSGTTYFGTDYDQLHTITRPAVYLKTTESRFEPLDGRQTVLWGKARLRASAYFKVSVTTPAVLPDYEVRPAYVNLATVNTLDVQDMDVRFPVMARSDQVSVTLHNPTPFPMNVETLEWEIDYTPTGRRAQ